MTSTHNEKAGGDHIIHTPIWILIIRFFQILLSLIVLGLSGYVIHGAYLETLGFAIATTVLTWLAVVYLVVSEKIFHRAYHIIAILVVEGLMVIFWLAAFAAVAADRAKYTVPTSVNGCVDDGSSIDSTTCFTKRGVLLFKAGAASMSAVAGIGALIWLTFIATFVWHMVMFFRARKEGRFQFGSSKENYQMEAKPQAQQQPLMAQNQPTAYQQQTAYAPQTNVPYDPAQAQYQQPQSPYQQQDSAYPPPQGTYYAPQEQQPYGQYPQQQQQPVQMQQPVQQHMTGQSYQAPPVHQGNELAGSSAPSYAGTYETSASPPPQQPYN